MSTGRTITYLAFASLIFTTAVVASPERSITFEDRVAAQRRIEQVYWDHRIWPSVNPGTKPSFDEVMPESALRAKVEDALRESTALDEIWGRPVTRVELQAELNRMAAGTRDPDMLRDLFTALDNDPTLIAETLARQTLVDRLARRWYAADPRFQPESRSFETWWAERAPAMAFDLTAKTGSFTQPSIPDAACTAGTWTGTAWSPATNTGQTAVWTGSEMIVWGGGRESIISTWIPARYDPATDDWRPVSDSGIGLHRRHTAVWTGTEMIVWGGQDADPTFPRNTGARYNPATDTWIPTSTGVNVPVPRFDHTAVWTGTQMIVWGGWRDLNNVEQSGGRYAPATDTWIPTSISSRTPNARAGHTAVWTGSEMIVWGAGGTDAGGRYNPATDSWSSTKMNGKGVPSIRDGHKAVWTGSEMIVWGGGATDGSGTKLNTGSRYDPATNKWKAMSLGAGVPSGRSDFAAVWTGSQFLVWGGLGSSGDLADGARYSPASDTWTPISGTGAPTARNEHSAVWTGTEMIVWGGEHLFQDFSSGGRYRPSTNSWVPTAELAIPQQRLGHQAVWTGTEMIAWGGDFNSGNRLSTGGRYDPALDSWSATSTTGAPLGRAEFTAVWSGTEMIVWGGSRVGVNNWLNTGGRYSPALNTWSPTSIGANVPAARARHTAVWTGTEMIVWGGSVGASGGRYTPASDSWQSVSTVGSPSSIASQVAVWTGDTMVVWPESITSNGGGRYSPATNSWSSMSTVSAPVARGTTAVWTGSRMIVWGGSTDAGVRLDTGGLYDPVADTWTPTSQTGAPSPRAGHNAVWSGQQMLVWGGELSFNDPPFADGAGYDPNTNAWTPIGSAGERPSGRDSFTAVWSGAEMIVWGGGSQPGTNTGGRYCP